GQDGHEVRGEVEGRRLRGCGIATGPAVRRRPATADDDVLSAAGTRPAGLVASRWQWQLDVAGTRLSMDAFFTTSRLHFFRPLTGKYREQVVACLRSLYSRLYSSLADYSRIVQRDLVLEVFQEAITRTPVLEAAEDDTVLPVRGDREQAGMMLNLLLEHGWIERHVDEVTLTSTYAFSRVGRLFTQPLHELEGGRFRTRHRNTRNTCNALRSFLEKPGHEASDLLDAYEYSERIVSDFSDVIAELEERKRDLLRDVEAQQLVQRASEEF